MPKSKSARYYATHPRARSKKKAYDAKLNSRPSQVKKRVESNRKRAQARKSGKNVRGLDYDHGSNRFIPTSQNRGKRSGTVGDRNARGRKKFRFKR